MGERREGGSFESSAHHHNGYAVQRTKRSAGRSLLVCSLSHIKGTRVCADDSVQGRSFVVDFIDSR